MAKQKKKNKKPSEQPVQKTIVPELAVKPGIFSFLPDFRSQAIFIILLGAIFYFNTLQNTYCLDDDIIVVKNQYVQSGFSGIKDIMSKDAFDSFYRQMNASKDQLSGGRYRPLSIVTFAMEQGLFGETNGQRLGEITDTLGKFSFADPLQNKRIVTEQSNLVASSLESNLHIAPIRHFVNVALFILSMVVLLNLLRNYFFKDNPDLAFLAVILFTIHPLHTEVIANVKSRDEIMSFLFICLTFIYAFRWQEKKETKTLVKAAACYFLALLSKEWGITLIVLIPMALYIFKKEDLRKSISAGVPFLMVALVYILIHIKFVPFGKGTGDADVMNNPYIAASKVQQLATKIFVLSKYLYLLFVPVALSADYSNNTIHFRSFADPDVWLSLIIHVSMIVAAIMLLRKRHFLSFALFFYLGNLLLVSNFVFNVGATMGERLIYHSSFGFVIIVAWALLELAKRISAENAKKVFVYALLVPVIALCGFRTIDRNADWKSDHTLFIHDAKVVPESVMANGNAGKSFIEMSEEAMQNKDTALFERDLDSATFYLKRSFKANPNYYIGYVNLGFISFKRRDYEKCEEYWNIAAATFPRAGHANFWKDKDDALSLQYYNLGMQAGAKKDFVTAEKYLAKAVKYSPNNSVYWADYGGANYELKNLQKALDCWTKALQINPNDQSARGGYKALSGKDWK